jgi:hypothetical protein
MEDVKSVSAVTSVIRSAKSSEQSRRLAFPKALELSSRDDR